MLEGIITKGYSGFYYVFTDGQVKECSLRGRFRHKDVDFLPGDKVLISLLKNGKGVVEEVLPRRNSLLRPTIANVDQVIIVLAIDNPAPDLNLLDRLLIQVEAAGVSPLICFNKIDLLSSKTENLAVIYRKVGYYTLEVSAHTNKGILDLRKALKDKVSVFAGPSGVGKSSLLNTVQPGVSLKTGDVSQKLRRGRHTTRHVELLHLDGGGLVADTPGFSALSLPVMKRNELAGFFPEMDEL
ncbi:MAG TPA: ribosome small subunit-dependent GTPase A, partial [Desulfobacteria bacterium]|nr:ribosome small subunit-dependent GTPase A [Desulfobacteria bacterium]